MSKQRAKGTGEETFIVRLFRQAGHTARRLSEGGVYDEGDVEAFIFGQRVIVESKARAALAPQTSYAKAAAKAGGDLAILNWKRLVKRPGASRATPVDGVARLWFAPPEVWLDLISSAYLAGVTDGTRGLNKRVV